MSTDGRIMSTFTLPSDGKVYEEEINPEVTLASMKTKHEIMRLSATGDNYKILADIIDDCIQNDIGISAYDLCIGDFQYLLYSLRVVTYGEEYSIYTRCPICGAENKIDVNLTELDINEYNESLVDLLTFDLPVSDHSITLTLQTPRLLDKISRLNKADQRKHKGDNSFLYMITNSIIEVDGEPANPIVIEKLISELPMKDTATILNRIKKVNDFIGVQTQLDDICGKCGQSYTTPFRIQGDFFRPTNF